jgi:hypothetical protein
MPKFDAKLASMHSALVDAAEIVMDMRRERDDAKLLVADQATTIRRQRDIIALLKEENDQLKQMMAWMNTGKEDAA